MKELVFFLEEESAQVMLEGVLPRLFPAEGIAFRYITFDGKQDLEKQLPGKLRSYQNSQAKFVVIRDQDSHPDCKVVKAKLVDLCSQGRRPDAMVRVACRELESFYLADLAAVERGLGMTGLTKHQANKKFRSPDYLGSPSDELLALTKGKYQKVGGSRAIGIYLDLNNLRSDSFRNLISGIRRLAALFN